jgi:hypothetical protein
VYRLKGDILALLGDEDKAQVLSSTLVIDTFIVLTVPVVLPSEILDDYCIQMALLIRIPFHNWD